MILHHYTTHKAADALDLPRLRPGQPLNALAHSAIQTLLNEAGHLPRADVLERMRTEGFAPRDCRDVLDALITFQVLASVAADDGKLIVFIPGEEVA